MSKMKYIPVNKVWELESWGVELGGMLSALSLTIDSLTDYPDCDKMELDAAYSIQCALHKLKKEFDAIYTDLTTSAIPIQTGLESPNYNAES